MCWSAVRVVWAKECSNYWWERIVKLTFTNDWIENVWEHIHTPLWQAIQKKGTVLIEQRVAPILWRLATTTVRLSNHWAPFFVSPKQYIVCVIVKDVCSAITEVLLKQYIKVPTVDSQQDCCSLSLAHLIRLHVYPLGQLSTAAIYLPAQERASALYQPSWAT